MIANFNTAETVKKGIKKWIPLFLLTVSVLIPFTFLLVKAAKVNSWDNWSFGSAQTMLTARHWGEDGFIKNKMLFIPSGYHSKIEFLDRPEFRFLANGTETGGLIGARLYYTHYPSGYLVPFGLLAKIGVSERFFYRLLAILLSTASIFFLFGFIYLLFDKKFWPALIATVFYSTSATYLGYADSLANMPIDDFFKYAILFLSLYSYKSPLIDIKIKNKLKYLTWSLFFILAISSYDSTFFVFVWLVALDFINAKKFSFKSILLWGSAPVFAFLLQILQNTWYLGIKDMYLDLFGSFLFRSTQAPAAISGYSFFFKNLAAGLSTLGYFSDMRTRFALPVIIGLVFLIYKFKLLNRAQWKYVGALFGAGMVYPVLFPVAGTFGYQGRQSAAFLLALIAGATFAVLMNFKNFWKKTAVGCCALFLLTGAVWAFHAKGTYGYVKDWPNNTIDANKIKNWREINSYSEPETIVVALDETLFGSELFFAQFYSDRLILPFENINDLISYSVKIKEELKTQEKFLAIVPDEKRAEFLENIKQKNNIEIIKENVEKYDDAKNNYFYISIK